MKIEFIGGPLDGDTAEIDPTMREFRYPLPRPMQWMCDGTGIPDHIEPPRYGVYAPKGNPRDFIWRGER